MKDKITFTLAEIRKHSPCEDGWKKLNKTLGLDYGENTAITISQIIDSNGLEDAFWCLRTTPKKAHYLWRHFAADCAASVSKNIDDERILKCIEISHLYAEGEVTEKELAAAESAAWSATRAAARAAACAAARAAAESAAWSAAWSTAARAAARSAAWSVAWSAAESAAWSAAWSTARVAQAELLKEYCRTGERVTNAQDYFKDLK